MTWKPKHPSLVAGAIGGLLCAQLAQAQSIDQLYEAGEERILQAQAQQEEINAIVEVTEDRFNEYQTLLREIEDLEVFNNLLQAQVNAQRRQLADLRASIDEVSVIERQILPLMARMISGLERFIELDMPFLLDERMARVNRLRDVLRRSDVTVATQFGAVMDAWLTEMDDYGNYGEVYTDLITGPDGISREVDILRVGRVGLYYRTPDGGQVGSWDNEAKQWVLLDEEFSNQIQIGIESYRNEQPAMFVVPVPAPEEG